jgi:hypothetical protein
MVFSSSSLIGHLLLACFYTIRANGSFISPEDGARRTSAAQKSRRDVSERADSANCRVEADVLVTSADTVLTCVIVLLVAGLLRASIAMRVPLSSERVDWLFPALEGPIFLAEFLGLAKALFGTMLLECFPSRPVSVVLLVMLSFFVPVAFLCILAHVRTGEAHFLHLQSPSRDRLLSKRRQIYPCKFGNIFLYLPVMACINERGVWQFATFRSQRWNFMIRYFWAPYWTYTLW